MPKVEKGHIFLIQIYALFNNLADMECNRSDVTKNGPFLGQLGSYIEGLQGP